ncbi:hypothetical protein [Pseudogemmobacter humi]|uniref:Uncharacterized protein n=1 Tax=Pseudogemmobacter humi TaxID=2483812 RepID=A0A3P5XFB5_9RHOB|nr:hypothetical protein [Pseudogemmobacter humi]VDC33448.1 hypothetical protein XINFAN_03840 [Pseudogemmobacter humi]
MAEVWLGLQRRGAGALQRGARRRAALWFRLAWALALTFRRDDPRRAAGLALLARADRQEARAARRLARALALWPGVMARLEAGPAPQTARSSAFHLRMEVRHRAACEAMARREVMDLGRRMEQAMRSGAPVPPPMGSGPLAEACHALRAAQRHP